MVICQIPFFFLLICSGTYLYSFSCSLIALIIKISQLSVLFFLIFVTVGRLLDSFFVSELSVIGCIISKIIGLPIFLILRHTINCSISLSWPEKCISFCIPLVEDIKNKIMNNVCIMTCFMPLPFFIE